MKVQKKIDVYLVKKRNARPIEIVQADTAVQLVFTVKDFEIPTGTTATLFVQKPSGKFVYQETGITVDGSTITIDLENQAITEKGNIPYQLGLKNGTDEITTFEGLMMVDRSLKDSAAEESKTVISAFDIVALEKLNEFQTRAEQFAQAVIATIPEDYTVMEAKVNESANAIKGMLKGAIVTADDVSPVEHVMNVKVVCPDGIDPSTVTLTRCEKNLIPFPYTQINKVDNGVTFDAFTNGAIRMKGTSSDYALFFINSTNIELQNGVSYDLVQPNTTKARLIMNYLNENGGSEWIGSTIVWKDSYTFESLYIQIDPSVIVDEVYVPVIKRTDKPIERYMPNSDGTVTGMTSLSPNMTILTDTEGVIVECEYNVETKKFIEKYLREKKSARIGEVRLTASGWVGASSPYSQVVHIDGVTENSQVDLTPSIEQLAVFYEKDLGFVTENVDGVVTVYAIGQKPQNEYTIQVTITEVDYE